MTGPDQEARPGAVLVVCTGNICRSPYIEHLLRQGLDEAWGPGRVQVSSAGTRGLVDEPMFAPAAEQLRRAGVDPGGFRSRRLQGADVRAADIVLTATRAHRASVIGLHPAALRYAVTFAEVALAAASVPPAPASQEGLAAWLRRVATAVVGRRSATLGRPPEELDIDDPYGREAAAYAHMADQVSRWLPSVLTALSPVAGEG